jgi:tetratricopeptide (TPR) repeat protein
MIRTVLTCLERRTGQLDAWIIAVAMLFGPIVGASAQRPLGDSTRVYVPTFERLPGRGGENVSSETAVFATQVVRLSLIRLRGVVVEPRSRECRKRESPPPQTQQAPPVGGRAPEERADFYYAVGKLSADSAALVVDIELNTCLSSGSRTLAHIKRLMTPGEQLLALTNMATSVAAALDASRPRVRVAVRPALSDSVDRGLSGRVLRIAVEALTERIDESDEMIPVDADSAADFSATVMTSIIDSIVTAQIVLQRANAVGTADTAVVRSSVLLGLSPLLPSPAASTQLGVLRSLFRSLATQALARLDLMRHAPTLSSTAAINDLDPDQLSQRAREALCTNAKTDCHSDPELALRMVGAALSKRESRRDRALLGRAADLLGQRANAIVAYRAAIEPQKGDAIGDALSTAEQIDVMRSLLRIFRAASAPASALEIFDQLLLLVPDDTILQLEKARTLEYAGRRADAIQFVAGLAAASERRTYLIAFDSLLRDMQASEVADHADLLQDACRAAPALRATCLAYLRRADDALGRTALNRVTARNLAHALLSVDSDTTRMVKYLTQVAESYLGTATYVVGIRPGRIERYPEFGSKQDSAEAFVVRAEALPLRDANARARLLRARAELDVSRAQYERAYETAKRAVAERDGPDGLLLMAQAATLAAQQIEDASGAPREPSAAAMAMRERAAAPLARLVSDRKTVAYVYFREVNHALGRDQVTTEALRRALSQDPTDREAADVLGYLCVEYSFDFQCGLDMSSRLMVGAGLITYDDSLNAAEAAVLADKYELALQWVAPLWVRAPTNCRRAVAAFYETWAAYGVGDSTRRTTAQSRWLSAITAVDSERTPDTPVCWLFGGAETRLRTLQWPGSTELRNMLSRFQWPR